MRTRWLKLTVAYDGTAYAGWQIQPDQPTVQGALEARLAGAHAGDGPRHRRRPHRRRRPRARPGRRRRRPKRRSRTTICIAASTPCCPKTSPCCAVEDGPRRLPRHVRRRRQALSLPDPQRPHAAGVRPPLRLALSPAARRRRDARRRAGARRPPRLLQLRIGRLRTARFGPHDSRAHRRATCSDESHDRVTIEVAGDGFLYNMVRTIVGTLVEVGRGTRDVSWPAEVLAARDRRHAGQTAPPHGLFLVSVDY